MAQPQVLYISNDNTIEIDELLDESDAAVTSGTCTYALKDSDGDAVSGATGSLSHVALGLWRGDLPSTVSLTNNANYSLEVTFTGSGKDAFWRVPCVAQYRS